MKVGILGTGDVGKMLATGFTKLGYSVMIGSRDPTQQKVKDIVSKLGKGASAGTFAQAAKFGDIAVFTVSWTGAENAAKLIDAKNLAGKIVIDTTNPLDFSTGSPKLAIGHTTSAAEQVQKWFPQSHVVKAFNHVANAHMFKPDFPDGSPDMFICGNDDKAKKEVTKILHEFGWPSVIDMGGIEAARLIEPFAMLYIAYAIKNNKWNIAFRMMQK
jgi:NADPH-dependent F420 reductase